ncbi:MAG: APC family permease [Anaerolineales bacterium]|nr:APC family permease [Anaerolineales bacterium]
MATINLRRLLIGNPLATSQAHHERLTKVKALAVFASDALSSNAYATEEILLVLVLAGTSALQFSIGVAAAIAVLLVIVGISYYQIIRSYPHGGGTYIVSKDNLGTLPSLVAGAALLIDYVLTVAVSIAAGVAALFSWLPFLLPYRVPVAIAAIAAVTLINLRGVRESASIFAAPTYVFVLSVLLLLAAGLYRLIAGTLAPIDYSPAELAAPMQTIGIFFILRAFSAGCTALTGIEAIADGVPAFRKPEAVNAGHTLIAMIILLGSMFIGISLLSHQLGIVPIHGETVLSQMARAILGQGPAYVVVQLATALILILAANTAFADFPRLSSFIARDGFLPRPLANLGDRLVFSNGIILLGTLASLLIIAFQGDTHALLPLYAIGVFLCFTLSQAGMVVRWFRLRPAGWHSLALLNGAGMLTTFLVLVVIVLTRFTHGGWIVVALIPAIVWMFFRIHDHYRSTAAQLSLDAYGAPPRIRRNRVVVPIAGVHRGVLEALNYARTLSNDVTAVYVETDPQDTARLRDKWARWGDGVRLEVLPSEYRSIIEPLIGYLDRLDACQRDDVITVVMPQFLPSRWWHNILHNQTALLLRLSLLLRRGMVVTDVPYRLKD